MKKDKKLVSYIADKSFNYRLMHEVRGTKNVALAMYVDNTIGIYKNDWWYILVGDESFCVYPANEAAAVSLIWELADKTKSEVRDFIKKEKLV